MLTLRMTTTMTKTCWPCWHVICPYQHIHHFMQCCPKNCDMAHIRFPSPLFIAWRWRTPPRRVLRAVRAMLCYVYMHIVINLRSSNATTLSPCVYTLHSHCTQIRSASRARPYAHQVRIHTHVPNISSPPPPRRRSATPPRNHHTSDRNSLRCARATQRRTNARARALLLGQANARARARASGNGIRILFSVVCGSLMRACVRS